MLTTFLNRISEKQESDQPPTKRSKYQADFKSEEPEIIKDVRNPCHQCDYFTDTANNLKQHIESKHEGARYPCDQCDYCATQAGNLKRHKESKHEGVRYPCDQCDYAATRASHLKRHKESKHEGVRPL